ncbi:MAG: DUF4864 domain-containing protein [Paracoccaceae bacterium]
MRNIVLAAGLALATALPAQAQEDGNPAPLIQDVIGAQLDAFGSRDLIGAWEHASPTIRSMFGHPMRFAMMVERGYPMVWDSADVAFIELREERGALVQRIAVRDARGVVHGLDYRMIELGGEWMIDGVTLLPAPDPGV